MKYLKVFLTLSTLLLAAESTLVAQQTKGSVNFTSSNLPIVYIKTDGGARIPDEPSIGGTMQIIDNGYNKNNKTTDPINGYNGRIKIEMRGSWTLNFPQKSYAITTVDQLGADLDDTLLGMKKEHKWVLYAPYDDYTQILNALTFKLTRKMGRWAPHTRYCEVMIDTGFGYQYNGVYVMMEKIKRDKNRVDISKLDSTTTSGNALTGGYIVAIDKNINGGDLGFTTKKFPTLFVKYVYPKGDEINNAQKKYIQNYIDTVETALKANNFDDPTDGYRKYMDEYSFIDFFIIQELSKNLDGFKRSAYMYKDNNSINDKLFAGPQWDFNSAWGNSIHTAGPLGVCDFEKPEGWVYLKEDCWLHLLVNSSVPFYWKRLMQDPEFVHHLNCRWTQLRQNTLSKEYISSLIDSLGTYIKPAAQREITKFDLKYNYNNQIDSLKQWITKRIDWLDKNMPGSCPDVSVAENNEFFQLLELFPNPAQDVLNVRFKMSAAEKITIRFTDALGRVVIDKGSQSYPSGYNQLELLTSDLAPGAYYLSLSSSGGSTTRKIIVTP